MTSASSPGLLARLAEAAPRLNATAVAEELRDPFWTARFGERARRFALEDGLHHFTYVGEALAAGDLAVVENYARWLRSVLVPRGMCTLHLVDSFRVRARLVEEEAQKEGWPDAAAVVAVFDAAERALARDSGPAGAVEKLVPRILQRAPELRHLLSYLVDALAVGDSAVFTRHLAWLRGQEAGRAAEILATLRGALSDVGLPSEVMHFIDADEAAA